MMGSGRGSGGGRGESRDHELLVEGDLESRVHGLVSSKKEFGPRGTHDELDERVVERLVVQKSRPLDKLEHVVDEVFVEGVCSTQAEDDQLRLSIHSRFTVCSPRSERSSFCTLQTSYIRVVAGVRSLASMGTSERS
jgi:hypothetical protein